MPKKSYPTPRFAETPAEREKREYEERRAKSAEKIAKHFPKGTEHVKQIEKRLGMKVRIVGMIEGDKIVGRVEPDTLATHTERNGGPLKRINPNPEKDD